MPKNLTIETRWDQMFPVLDPSEIERVRHFGTLRSYRKTSLWRRPGA